MTAIDINLFCIWHGRSEKHSDKWYGCIVIKLYTITCFLTRTLQIKNMVIKTFKIEYVTCICAFFLSLLCKICYISSEWTSVHVTTCICKHEPRF